jgi:NAD(P)-dependent dehydrogenase (short-subunit alcohol dehydrogenase family)
LEAAGSSPVTLVFLFMPPIRWQSGTAVITGAASGLGRALALELAAARWRLVLADLDPDRLGAVAREVEAGGGAAEPTLLDVRDADAWRGLRDRLEAQWPTLDMLVNCAGVGATGEVGRLVERQWERVIETNLIGTALGCETFLPWLRRHPSRSHLVNVASIAGILAPPSMAAYAASKAGVIALSEAIAAECGGRRPGVTIVCPGFFRSGLLETWHFTSGTESREARRRMGGSRWSSEAVARRVVRAIDKDRRYVVVGRKARWLWRMKRLAPRATTSLIAAVYRRLR